MFTSENDSRRKWTGISSQGWSRPGTTFHHRMVDSICSGAGSSLPLDPITDPKGQGVSYDQSGGSTADSEQYPERGQVGEGREDSDSGVLGRAVSLRQLRDFSGKSHGFVSAQGMNKLREVRKQKRGQWTRGLQGARGSSGEGEELEMKGPLRGLAPGGELFRSPQSLASSWKPCRHQFKKKS